MLSIIHLTPRPIFPQSTLHLCFAIFFFMFSYFAVLVGIRVLSKLIPEKAARMDIQFKEMLVSDEDESFVFLFLHFDLVNESDEIYENG